MSRLKISKIFVSTAIILLNCISCSTVHVSSPSQKTKSEVLNIWGHPTRICTDTNKLKYGGDEMWIYKNPERLYSSDPVVEERLYFKDGILIKEERITLDSL